MARSVRTQNMSIDYFVSLCPVSILASSGLGTLSSGLTCVLPGIRADKSCILDDAFLDDTMTLLQY